MYTHKIGKLVANHLQIKPMQVFIYTNQNNSKRRYRFNNHYILESTHNNKYWSRSTLGLNFIDPDNITITKEVSE